MYSNYALSAHDLRSCIDSDKVFSNAGQGSSELPPGLGLPWSRAVASSSVQGSHTVQHALELAEVQGMLALCDCFVTSMLTPHECCVSALLTCHQHTGSAGERAAMHSQHDDDMFMMQCQQHAGTAVLQ